MQSGRPLNQDADHQQQRRAAGKEGGEARSPEFGAVEDFARRKLKRGGQKMNSEAGKQ